MPQMRIYHQGRYMYYRPGKTVHFLPPLQPALYDGNDPPETRSVLISSPSNGDNATEGSRRHRRHIQYRKLLNHISISLTRENIDDMRFLAKEHIYPSHLLDRVTNGRSFIALLEHKRLLAENSLHFLQTLLYYVARNDLYERVFRFRFDIQGNLKKSGVIIEDKYNLRQRPKELLQLPVEVKSFQNDLNPRSRFKNVNIPTLQVRMDKLSTKLDDTIQRRSTSNVDLFDNGTLGTTEYTHRNRLKTKRHSALGLGIPSQVDKRESLPELKPCRIHIPTENSMVQEIKRPTSGSNGHSQEPASEDCVTKEEVDVKMKKLRRRLNVNLSKHHEEDNSMIKHQYRRAKRQSKKTPFIRKAGESKGMISTSHVNNLMIKQISPLIE